MHLMICMNNIHDIDVYYNMYSENPPPQKKSFHCVGFMY